MGIYAQRAARLLNAAKSEEEAFNRLVGQAIIDARCAKCWKQSVLARRLGISQSSLTRIERGQTCCTLWRLVQIAKLTGRPVQRMIP